MTSSKFGWADRIAAVLLLLCALVALISFIAGIQKFAVLSPAMRMAETWRLFGLIVFVGLFVLLAFWPRHYAGIWELVIFHKVVIAIASLAIQSGAQRMVIIDVLIALFVIIAYFLTRGYSAWAALRRH